MDRTSAATQRKFADRHDDGSLALDESPINVERIDFENPPPPDATGAISESEQTKFSGLFGKRLSFDAASFLRGCAGR